MTRISTAIKPIELCDQMLIAEHREIIRIPNTIKSGKAKVNLSKIPKKFRLGAGHVMFFYNKLKYLRDRYRELHKECLERGFNVQDYSSCFLDLPHELFKDYEETPEDRKLLIERINTRLNSMKNIRYYSESIELEVIKLMN